MNAPDRHHTPGLGNPIPREDSAPVGAISISESGKTVNIPSLSIPTAWIKVVVLAAITSLPVHSIYDRLANGPTRDDISAIRASVDAEVRSAQVERQAAADWRARHDRDHAETHDSLTQLTTRLGSVETTVDIAAGASVRTAKKGKKWNSSH